MNEIRRIPNDDTEWLYAPDVPYVQRESGALTLQLIFPYRCNMPQDERYPLIIFIPGAAWYKQEMYNSVPQWAKLAEKGAVVAAVQVRASTEAKFPAQVEDVLEAIRHLAKDADKWHIDPHRMYLYGHSSGGHIALMTVLKGRDELAAAQEFTIRGVMTVCAPTDMMLCGGQPSLDLLGIPSLEADPDRVRAASCGPYITRNAPMPRMLLIHGTQDDVVPITHAERLHRQMVIAGKRVEFLCVSGAGHGGAWLWREGLIERVMRFVEQR